MARATKAIQRNDGQWMLPSGRFTKKPANAQLFTATNAKLTHKDMTKHNTKFSFTIVDGPPAAIAAAETKLAKAKADARAVKKAAKATATA